MRMSVESVSWLYATASAIFISLAAVGCIVIVDVDYIHSFSRIHTFERFSHFASIFCASVLHFTIICSVLFSFQCDFSLSSLHQICLRLLLDFVILRWLAIHIHQSFSYGKADQIFFMCMECSCIASMLIHNTFKTEILLCVL